MVLNSKNISLRPLMLEDLNAIYQWRNDKDLRFLAIAHPFPVTLEQERHWLTKLLNDTSNHNIIFAAEFKESKELFGYFQLREINMIHKHAYLGIIIGKQSLRGLGFGKEVMKLGLDYGFSMLGLQKISLEVLESNVNAIKLYNSLEFNQEGKFDKHYYFDGEWHTVIRMAKIRK